MTAASSAVTAEALRRLGEVVHGEPIPSRIAPAVVVSNWNESPERTEAEVLAAFDEAIRLLDAEIAARGR